MNGFIISFKYWRSVVHDAWLSALERLEIRSVLLTLFIQIVSLLILIATRSFSFLPIEIALLLENVLEDTKLQVLYFVVAGILVFIIFSFFLVYTPARLFDELGGFLNWDIAFQTEEGWGRSPEKNIGIRIFNNSPIDIENCYVEIIKVVNTENDEQLLNNREILLWSARHEPQNEPKVLKGFGNLLLSVAETLTDTNRCWFTTTFRKRHHLIFAGTYTITINIHGTLKNRNFNEQYQFNISYSGGDNLHYVDELVQHIGQGM